MTCRQQFCQYCSITDHHGHRYKKGSESDEPDHNPQLKHRGRYNSITCTRHKFTEDSFCEDCNKPICVACLEDEHKDHKWKPKNKYIEHIVDSVQNEMPKVRKQLASIIRDCEQRTEATINQLASTEEHIRRQADRLRSMIDEQEAALFKRAQDTSDQRVNLIQQHMETANGALAKASVYSETEPATTDEDVRSYKELSDKIAAVLKDIDDTINTPLPAEAQVDLVMKETATERIVQTIQSQFGQVVCLSQPAGPSDINVTGTGEKRAFVGMPSKFEITTVNNPPKLPCLLTSDVSCILVPRHNQMAGKIMCECRREAENKIVVSYTARESGAYNMQLKLDGNCVLGQPTVMIAPPFAYENTIKPVENLLGPTGVSVCSNGVIVLAESAGNSIMLKELGSKRKRFGKRAGGSANGQFLNPTAVAFVPDVSQIIVADTGNHRIQKFDLQGQLVDSVGSKGQDKCQFDKPVAITIDSKKRVYVAEAGNSRIQVLTSELSFVRFIQLSSGDDSDWH